jgi:hypothetical protein
LSYIIFKVIILLHKGRYVEEWRWNILYRPHYERTEQYVFQHVVIKIRQLFLRLAACLTSTFLGNGVVVNDAAAANDLCFPKHEEALLCLLKVKVLNDAWWPCGQCTRRTIAQVKQRWSVIRWVNKMNYLELLRASKGTLCRLSRLHLQSLLLRKWKAVVRNWLIY